MLTKTFKTPLLLFPLFELSCCCHGFVPVNKLTDTCPAIITRCFATENIIRGKNNKNFSVVQDNGSWANCFHCMTHRDLNDFLCFLSSLDELQKVERNNYIRVIREIRVRFLMNFGI